jgi:hypothetical protein
MELKNWIIGYLVIQVTLLVFLDIVLGLGEVLNIVRLEVFIS